MKRHAVSRWFSNVSIARKLYFTVGIMATLIAIELIVLFFSIHTLSSVRGYVGGEGLWSKAQKDAAYQLLKYGRTHDETDYQKFLDFMKVPLGDHKTLVELSKEDPDIEAAGEGFEQGRIDKGDVEGMIKLFRRFNRVSYIKRAIEIWIDADSLVSGLIPIGKELHQQVSDPNPSQQKIDAVLQKIDPLNAELTKLEDDFSYTLGEGSRWLEQLVLKLLFAVALTVELTGLLLAIAVSRSIQKGLNEILLSAQAVAKGDFSRKAAIYSKDEIGILANNFNTMSESLEKLEKAIREVNITLEKKVQQRTGELESKNKELEQFAYVASHDLQEPLRTTSGFVDLLRKQYRGKLDAQADKYIDYIVQSSDRMKILIKDLLDYSRIGREKNFTKVDCNTIVQEVLADLDKVIKDNHAIINTVNLPVISGHPTELKLLFQNIISNSIKFHKQDIAPVVDISFSKEDHFWKFAIHDNGIGIDKKHQERIFIIFQRLHTRSDYEGSGIGLAHCKKIVELHGGNIWVESAPDKGSTFFFTIPEA